MSLLDIRLCTDPVLRKTCAPVTLFDAELKKLAANMLETMYDAPGIGLAAPQIGIPQRLLVIDIADHEEGEEKKPLCIINPEIIWKSEETNLYREGCLSVPEIYAEVTRPAEVRLRYQGLDGKEQELEAKGLLSTCVQHEIDHLNGVLFIDYLSKLKRDMIMRKMIKLSKLED